MPSYCVAPEDPVVPPDCAVPEISDPAELDLRSFLYSEGVPAKKIFPGLSFLEKHISASGQLSAFGAQITEANKSTFPLHFTTPEHIPPQPLVFIIVGSII